MAGSKQWYLVSYDVRDARRLRRVAKRLAGYGLRQQYSMFRCRLTTRQLERLTWELKKIMDEEDDLLVVGLCERCVRKIARRNPDEAWAREAPAGHRVI